MLLKSIKLAGFKSFVDPTTFHIQSPLTAIVGPNGCGKSNIVDAVRWVVGEISAKQLRGESMTDVIFNGTTNRKPVGQASIELAFDNHDGSIGGQYASYSEICIRREVTRDSQSNYYLNGTRVRRKDILDIFLGTGLGPRSYSIIEQGMISRLIEAKPEEMRVHIEEVAGVSKYKERRRETANRIKHTRENLDRLTDLREEVTKQLEKLERQAKAAERYKVLKAEERLLRAQVQALHYQEIKQQIDQQETSIRDTETSLDAKIAEQRGIDSQIETLRQNITEQTDIVNEIQGKYYRYGADIARLEQQINHHQSRQQQLETDLAELTQHWEEAEQQQSDDQAQLTEVSAEIAELEPAFEIAKEDAAQAAQRTQAAEQAMQNWQEQWEQFNQAAAQVQQQAEVERTRIQHLTHRIDSGQHRLTRISEELAEIDFANLDQEIKRLNETLQRLQGDIETVQQQLTDQQQQLTEQRERNQQLEQSIDQHKRQLHEKQAKQASLEALQQTALGKTNEMVNQWLQHQQLTDKPRLAEGLTVEPGWEHAVEVVLGPYLEAVCMHQLQPAFNAVDQLSEGNVTLFDIQQAAGSQTETKSLPTLASKIQSDWPLANLISHIYIAQDLQQAQAITQQLASYEMVVMRDGTCLGPAWLKINKATSNQTGVIERQQQLESIAAEIAELEQQLNQLQHELEEGKETVTRLESEREQSQAQKQQITTEHSQAQGNFTALQSRRQELADRHQKLTQEQSEIETQLVQDQQDLQQAQQLQNEAEAKTEAQQQERQQLLSQKENCQQTLQQARQRAVETKEKMDNLQVRLSAGRSQQHHLEQNLGRLEKQLSALRERQTALTEALSASSEPLPELQEQLTQLLEQRLTVENALQQARQQLQAVEHELKQQETERTNRDDEAGSIRNQLEQLRMQWQGAKVRLTTHQEQIAEMGYELEQLVKELPAEAELSVWTEELASIERKIQRLGAINLAAIDELEQLKERKTYLDAQNADLEEALATLEEAINKIDKETKERFRETFETVNKHFAELFPKIFGGGKAELEMTDNDWLTAGIQVKAQPPGKRNATIHLLSGGEKALTAIALVFSLFQLNPSPFCILDEVDAPLDDVNVGRYCNLVKEMSDKVQFVVITHNKVTMEMSQQLAGITMHEPGVSRLVSVDIDEAMKMAEQDSNDKKQKVDV